MCIHRERERDRMYDSCSRGLAAGRATGSGSGWGLRNTAELIIHNNNNDNDSNIILQQ